MSTPIRLSQGKYNAECEAIQSAVEAEGVFLLVIGGKRGAGFSATAAGYLVHRVPDVLRTMADELEKMQKVAGGN